MYVPRAMYSLRMSFWTVPCSALAATPCRRADRHVEGEQDGGGGVDRHRRRDPLERDALEAARRMSSSEAIDDADPADLAARPSAWSGS